jgi:hypothetical protein
MNKDSLHIRTTDLQTNMDIKQTGPERVLLRIDHQVAGVSDLRQLAATLSTLADHIEKGNLITSLADINGDFRSATPMGFAQAMFEASKHLLEHP